MIAPNNMMARMKKHSREHHGPKSKERPGHGPKSKEHEHHGQGQGQKESEDDKKSNWLVTIT